MKKLLLITAAAFLMCAASPSGHAADQLQLDAYKGKVVVVDFWASWCVPCRRSFPWMNAMQAKYGEQGLIIVGINLDKEADAAAMFLEEVPANFRIHYDPDAKIAQEFGVEAMPSSFVVGRDGDIVAKHLGFKVKRQDEYEAVLVDALGANP
jgi:thiol-disulfide isomerase/thioredoxin